jgi:hypothetical protein
MNKSISFKTECLALGLREEFRAFKLLYSQSQGSALRKKQVFFKENVLAVAGVSFGTTIWEEVEGPSMWVGRGVSLQVDEIGNFLQVLGGDRT